MEVTVLNIEYHENTLVKVPVRIEVSVKANPYQTSKLLMYFPYKTWVDNFIGMLAKLDTPEVECPKLTLEAILDYASYLELERLVEAIDNSYIEKTTEGGEKPYEHGGEFIEPGEMKTSVEEPLNPSEPDEFAARKFKGYEELKTLANEVLMTEPDSPITEDLIDLETLSHRKRPK